MRTRERSAWVQVGEDHPFLVSAVFSRDSVAYLSAQRTIGRRWAYSTLFWSKILVPVLVLSVLSGGIVGAWYFLPHEILWGVLGVAALVLLVPVFRSVWERISWYL
jgi:hypothetical protein